MATPTSLAEFRKPPVIETAIGLEFEPIVGWELAHFGAFWETIRGDFPRTSSQPALSSQIENLEAGNRWPNPVFQISSTPPLRVWFVHRDETRLIQLQQDRLILNWRKVGPNTAYPSYALLRPEFEETFDRFQAFLESQGLPLPAIRQCELTYVDHIEKGTNWTSFADLQKVTPAWAGLGSAILPAPESVSLNARFLMPSGAGRLHVDLQPAVRLDGTEVLQLSITARGAPISGSPRDVQNWYDLAHQWAVHAFLDVTTPQMHELWEKT